jgi:hypothetical protein
MSWVRLVILTSLHGLSFGVTPSKCNFGILRGKLEILKCRILHRV